VAIEMDSEIRLQMSRHPNIWWRRKTYNLRKIIRFVLRKIDRRTNLANKKFEPQWTKFSTHSESLRQNGYVFVENFLNEVDARLLSDRWPKTRYLAPISPIEDHKTSDKGLVCSYGKPKFDIEKTPIIWNLYEVFLSDSFTSEVSALCGDGVERTPYHMLIQNSYWGSGLAPHRDSHGSVEKSKINIIYFVDSNGLGWEAGGTAILSTNNFENPIFVPTVLQNSCLFYYSESLYFHGFPMMKFGKFRKNVIAHYCAK